MYAASSIMRICTLPAGRFSLATASADTRTTRRRKSLPAMCCPNIRIFLFLKYISENENPFQSLAFRCPAVNMYDVITKAIMRQDDLRKVEKGKDILVGFDRKIKISRDFLEELKSADITQRDFSDLCGQILILQGTRDEIVPFAAVEAFADRNLLDFEAVENADHRFLDPKIMERAIIRIAAFFELR